MAETKIIPRCSWCGKENPKHEGGYEKEDGTKAQGNFCNRTCFDRWKLAHSLIETRTGDAPLFPVEPQKEATAVKS